MSYNDDNSFSILLIFTALSFLGLLLIPEISVSLLPSYHNSGITITTNWKNVSARIVERELTSRLEGAFNTLEGIESIESVSSTEESKITLFADKYANTDNLRLDVSSIIRRMYPGLPVGVSYPEINQYNSNSSDKELLLTYTLHGPDDNSVLQAYAEKYISKRLSMVAGVDETVVYGGVKYQWQVKYNEDIVRKLNISVVEIKQAIRQYFQVQSIGHVFEKADDKEYLYLLELRNKNSEKIYLDEIPIKKVGANIVYLNDIASVSYIKQKANSFFRINGSNAVVIDLYGDDGVNSIDLVKRVRNNMILLENNLPNDYTLEESYNSTVFIEKEIDKNLKRTILTLIILLIFVFLVSISTKYVVLIILSLITNVSIAFIFYYLFGIEIHLYSLAGITVSLGLIIDNAIVMADHLIHRKNKRVFIALLASTSTTLISLFFIWLLPESLRLNLWDFAMILLVNLAVSLTIALYYIPALLTTIKLQHRSPKAGLIKVRTIVKLNKYYRLTVVFILKKKYLIIILLVLAFGLPVYMIPVNVEGNGLFAKTYNNSLGNPWYVNNVRPHINKVLGGSLRLFSNFVFEGSYYRKHEETKLFVQASMPKGASVQQLNEAFEELENYLSKYSIDSIKFISRITSAQSGRLIIYFNSGSHRGDLPYFLKSRIVSLCVDYGGVNWNVYGVGRGFSSRYGANEMIDLKIRLSGYNFDELEILGSKVKSLLTKHPRVRNVNIAGNRYRYRGGKSYEYILEPRIEEINRSRVTMNNIFDFINANSPFSSGSMGFIFNNEYNSISIVPALDYNSWDIINRPIDTLGNKLSALIKITKDFEEQSVYKLNQNYVRIVDFQYIGNVVFGERFLRKVVDEVKQELPLGYDIRPLGYSFDFERDAVSYTLLLALIAVMIFVICSILFESLIRPLAIMSIIPVSYIGIFLTFYCFDLNFDQGGYASFILVSGLVVNSAIYILNEFDNIRKVKRSNNILHMYVKAFNRKIIPILTTIISTILGLVPFVVTAHDEPFWFALTAGTIGGLLFSIMAIIIILPVFVLRKSSIKSY